MTSVWEVWEDDRWQAELLGVFTTLELAEAWQASPEGKRYGASADTIRETVLDKPRFEF